LQCATMYPCPPEAVGLNVIEAYRQKFAIPVGLSDHSATIYPGLAAATLGIEVLEVHVALSRDMFGPDVVASLLPSELRQLVDGIRFIERMKANPVDKEAVAAELQPLRRIFMKSVVAQRDLPAGAVLSRADLAAKKPGTGIAARELPKLIGKTLRRAVTADTPLMPDDVEDMERAS
jgi:N,N'-diacetyllegionaminate synthase